MMIRAKIDFKFQGKKYISNLEKNMERAIEKSALMVQRDTKQLLNQSGKSMPAKAGLNDTSTVGERKNKPAQKGMTVKEMKAARLYWYGEPLHRWVEASQPGNPPHKQTGTLQRSIMVQFFKRKLEARIGPMAELKYARVHEMGSDKMPMRPYLKPAFDGLEQKILQMMVDAVQSTEP